MTNFAERQYPQPGPTPPPVRAAWGNPRSKQVTWYDPARIAAGADGLSGLEFITALAEGRIAPAPIAALLNMRPVRAERGLVVFECVPDESVYNPIGVVHGGLLCTLADSVAGCAVHTTLPAGTGYTSIDITVNYTRPVTLDSGMLTATGRVTKPGRRVALATAEITDAAGRLVATASSNCLVIQPPG
jgi:uncharacterized protein (TIGR00369 family)